ncbi:hypothetical protein B0T19DRAFT_238701 [Cercophora scortea]|uniref:Uncharacterized protein n=1 Tax=Cercophora scortea TaxID=314031 RepID=A0AAE0II51_9PEZI|nr:hypothetical protein B0T19DRAFT_238701 [Cercophora scortea]
MYPTCAMDSWMDRWMLMLMLTLERFGSVHEGHAHSTGLVALIEWAAVVERRAGQVAALSVDCMYACIYPLALVARVMKNPVLFCLYAYVCVCVCVCNVLSRLIFCFTVSQLGKSAVDRVSFVANKPESCKTGPVAQQYARFLI